MKFECPREFSSSSVVANLRLNYNSGSHQRIRNWQSLPMKTQLFHFHSCLTVALFFTTNATGLVQAEQDFPSLMTKIPASANAVVVIDADKLRNSELGKKNKWADKNEAAYVNSPFILPPEANRIVIGSQLNPNNHFSQAWELAVMSLVEPISMRSIARAENGQLDEIAGIPAVGTPGNAYFVQLSDDVLGVMSPANRQLVARWATLFENPQDQDGYLSKAVQDVNDGAQIVLAIDLKNAVIPYQLSESLSESEFIQKKKHDQSQWEGIINSLLGVKLTVAVADKIEGKLSVDFASDPTGLGKDAKDAIIVALGRSGVGIESLDSWNLSQSQNQIRLEGELSIADLRKIMSILEMPGSDYSSQAESQPATESQVDLVAEASKKYYQSVSALLKDIEGEFKTNRDARHNFASTYMQRYAKRIDELPILNVDDELINFGLMVSETLRDTSVVQGTSNIQSGVRKSSVYKSNNVYDYNNTYRSTSSMKTQIAREEQAVASTARFNNWKEIQDATANIRVQMTKKYGVEF